MSRKQKAWGPVDADPQPADPIAELDELLAEALRKSRIRFTDADHDAIEREQIGYDESVHPYYY